MTDITDLKAMLRGRALEVAQLLLPRGTLQGHEWCVGSVQGEPGESLKVHIKGAKAGVWCDFAEGGEGGDLIDLWCDVKGMPLVAALNDIRTYLGVEKPRFQKPAKSYRRPEKPKCDAPAGPVRAYLIEKRKISPAALAAYKVGERGRDIVFVSEVDGKPLFVKYISIDRKPDGKKVTRVEPGCEPVLFGWQAIDPEAREITISEGEIDALTLFDYGIPAVSVPFGGGRGAKQAWIESEFDRLARFEVIYLAFDNDPEGEAAIGEVVSRLGRHRCRRVILPRKDANECRLAGIPQEDIRRCFDGAETMAPPELRRAGEFTDKVINLFWPAEGEEQGYRLPFAKVGRRLMFRPSEVTIWTGVSGAGKSQVLSHASVDFIRQGARVCIASLEMAPAQLLRRMVKQAAGTDRPSVEFIQAVMAWLSEGLWLFSVVGKSPIDAILTAFEYARARYGCDVFAIDSLMRLGVGSEDYEGQERAMYQLVEWAVGNAVHLHLVCHSRKGDAKFKAVPEIEDVKGAQEIGANAFNVVGILRNRSLEDQLKDVSDRIERGDESARSKFEELSVKPPAILNVAKQRNGDWEGRVGLWFDTDTYRYRSAHDRYDGQTYVTLAGHEADHPQSDSIGEL